MGTRGVIARPVGEGFEGRYHHWDSYPSGLGLTLIQLRNGFFQGDTDAMLRVLLDEHPAGWSTINSADFSLPAGFDSAGPNCYCHGSRSEDGWLVTAENASGSGCEYAYVLEGSRMLVMSSYHENGTKAIGMFGMGDPVASWRIIHDVDLDNPLPLTD